MYKTITLQIKEAIDSNKVSKKEASFVMSLINVGGSLNSAIESMLHYIGTKNSDDSIVLDTYSLREHIALSGIILGKSSNIIITESMLETMDT